MLEGCGEAVGSKGEGGQEGWTEGWAGEDAQEPPAHGGICEGQAERGGAGWRVGERLDCAGHAHICAGGEEGGGRGAWLGGWVVKAAAGPGQMRLLNKGCWGESSLPCTRLG